MKRDEAQPDLRRIGSRERRRALALLWQSAWPDRRDIVRAACFLAVAGLLEAAGPIFGKRFIDHYVLPRNVDLPAIALLLAGYLATGWLASALRYRELVRLAGLATRSVRRLRERVYAHVLALPMSFFDRAITGQLVSRITNDTEAVRDLYTKVLFELLVGLTILAGVAIAMLLLDWRLMLIVFLLVPATAGIVWGYQRLSAGAVTRIRELRSDINAQMAEGIAGMSVLQAAGAARRFGERFARTNDAQYRARLGEVRANAWLLRPALDLVNVLLIAALVAAIGTQSIAGVEVGLLYAFIAYLARVVEPLIQITLQFSLVQQSVIAAARVDALLHEGHPPPRRADARIGPGRVEVADVSFGYDPAQPVLHDVSLTVPAGSFVGVVGPTGSGKSTLLSLLLRFYVPQSGRIGIDGVQLGDIDDAQFRAAVGLVPQEPFLLAATVRENIDMGRGLPAADIEAAARAAHAHDFVERLPQGYDTPLGEGGARLSAGQKQLVAIARALAGRPRVLLLDEATSRIDSETERHVRDALAAATGAATVIAIAHRLSTIRDADCIVVLRNGRIVESGTHDALMAIKGGLYERLYVLQRFGEQEAAAP
ncbi:MAG TPA: ATP-binding cassette domain-containing protein [Casimicrobiaceae bacterium]|nr:ATP-binding cassette domain-containing protein [Casimicrobiaceae bacterium]